MGTNPWMGSCGTDIGKSWDSKSRSRSFQECFKTSCPTRVKRSSSQQPLRGSSPLLRESFPSIPQASAWEKREISNTRPMQRCLSTVHEMVEARTNRAIRLDRKGWSILFIETQNYKISPSIVFVNRILSPIKSPFPLETVGPIPYLCKKASDVCIPWAQGGRPAPRT